jgi:hypothetical protein
VVTRILHTKMEAVMSASWIWAAALAFAAVGGSAAAAGGINVWAAPDTCKVNPRSGNVLEEHYWHMDPKIPPPGYLRRRMGRLKSLPYYAKDSYAGPTSGRLRKKSPIWDAAARAISLRAARNEFAAFQIVIENAGEEPLTGVRPQLVALAGPAKFDAAGNVRMFRQYYMRLARQMTNSWNMTGPLGPKFWYPEVLVPFSVAGQVPFAIPDAKMGIEGQTNQAVWVDIYIPHKQAPGKYTGTVKVNAGNAEAIELKLTLEVLPLTLPDELTFTIDMMSSSRPITGHWRLSPRRQDHAKKYLHLEESFFRLFHEHRCTLNMFPGRPTRRNSTPPQVILPGFAPPLAGKGSDIHVTDWSEYDAHFGRYYTGEAFKDLPRAGVPVRHQFLPFSLGWPSRFSQYYTDRKTYEMEFKKILTDFAEHFQQKGWTRTEFQFFLNGKKKFGEPWNTDEPTSDADYAALRYWGELTQQALGPRRQRKVKFVYRVDIGTPQRMPGKIDQVVDLRNINYEAYPQVGVFWSPYRRKQEAGGETWWVYAADRGNQRWARNDWSMASSFLWAWAMWDLNTAVNCKWASLLWNARDPINSPGVQWSYCAYAYPGKPFGFDGPLPGLKLKATRRGLEDMEYLALLAAKDGNRRRADAILRKYYTTWNRSSRKPRRAGSVRVGPEDPYRLRADILAALGM